MTSEKRTQASFDGTTIRINQPQVIGFAGKLLPKTPGPDESLPFDKNDAVFSKDISNAWAEWYNVIREVDQERLAARINLAFAKLESDERSRIEIDMAQRQMADIEEKRFGDALRERRGAVDEETEETSKPLEGE